MVSDMKVQMANCRLQIVSRRELDGPRLFDLFRSIPK